MTIRQKLTNIEMARIIDDLIWRLEYEKTKNKILEDKIEELTKIKDVE